MSEYLTLEMYKLHSALPDEYIDAVEARYSGWVTQQIKDVSNLDIDGRLSKRYAAPFAAPYPPVVGPWVAKLVDQRFMIKRGKDAQDADVQEIMAAATLTLDQIREAADSENGLFDLPLATGASGISRGLPMAKTIASPYEAVYRREARARRDDRGY